MSLCLCMIVKNEADRLGNCLASVKDWVDDIVIVDTGSEDETIAIAESFGANIHHFEWCDDFAAARNYALQWVQSDWVLVLDADEVMVPTAVPPLTEMMRSPNTILINLLREEVGAKQSPFSLVSRLFRHHSDIQFRRPYHELVDDSISQIQEREPQWTIENLNGPAIQHFGYQETLIQSESKYERSQRLLEKGIQQYPKDAYLYSKLGGLQWDLKAYEQARTTLEQGLTLVQDEPAVSYELYYHLGLVYNAQGLIQEAEAAYQNAIGQVYPEILKIGAYLNLGSLYLNHGAHDPALKLFQHSVKVTPDLAQAHYNLGLALKTVNRLEDAIAAYQTAIALNPRYAAAYQNLGVVYFKLGKIAESRDAFEHAIALYEASNPSQAQQLKKGAQDLGILV